jgi:hypothetical protein
VLRDSRENEVSVKANEAKARPNSYRRWRPVTDLINADVIDPGINGEDTLKLEFEMPWVCTSSVDQFPTLSRHRGLRIEAAKER